MNKNYEEPRLTVFIIEDEIVRTSTGTGQDPFDDGYQDFGDNE